MREARRRWMGGRPVPENVAPPGFPTVRKATGLSWTTQ